MLLVKPTSEIVMITKFQLMNLLWKLTWLNAPVLSGKRGLIQRAVDSYRNRLPETRSRRVLRQEKLHSGTLRRRTIDNIAESSHETETVPRLSLSISITR